MRQTHPLSCSQSEFAALSSCKSEHLLVKASKTEKLFQTFREHAPYRIFNERTMRRPMVLSFLSGRFLLSVDYMTEVNVWDMLRLGPSSEAPNFPCAHLPALTSREFVTYSMTTDHSTLFVVFQAHTKYVIVCVDQRLMHSLDFPEQKSMSSPCPQPRWTQMSPSCTSFTQDMSTRMATIIMS